MTPFEKLRAHLGFPRTTAYKDNAGDGSRMAKQVDLLPFELGGLPFGLRDLPPVHGKHLASDDLSGEVNEERPRPSSETSSGGGTTTLSKPATGHGFSHISYDGIKKENNEYIVNGGDDVKGMVPNLWAQQPSKKAEQRIFDREAALALSTEYIEKGVENSILAKIHVLSPLKNKLKGRRHNHEAGKRQPFLLNKHISARLSGKNTRLGFGSCAE